MEEELHSACEVLARRRERRRRFELAKVETQEEPHWMCGIVIAGIYRKQRVDDHGD